eukprot:scaffold26302_cov112-Isochrysis_galbana.AAC.3
MAGIADLMLGWCDEGPARRWTSPSREEDGGGVRSAQWLWALLLRCSPASWLRVARWRERADGHTHHGIARLPQALAALTQPSTGQHAPGKTCARV